MSKSKHISHSSSETIGDGKCCCCRKKINGLFMVTHYYDVHARGNEGDSITARCANCIDSKDKVWLKYQKDVVLEQERKEKEAQRNANDPLRFAKIVAGECTYESEYDGRTYEHCFYCDANIGDGDGHQDDCVHLEAKALVKG